MIIAIESHNLRTQTSFSTPAYGIDRSEILRNSAQTLEAFLQSLSLCGEISLTGDDRFFEAARNKIEKSADLKAATEGRLQAEFFSYPRECTEWGNNILEVTSGQVQPDIANDFRKLNFCSQESKSKLPDLTLRIGDLLSNSTRSTRKSRSSSSPSWRLCPWTVIAYVDPQELEGSR